MCGIFGYVGNAKNTAAKILSGLKLLEYRGYDSWGIAVKNGAKLAVEKHIGKIGTSVATLPNSTIGIGHTRWATHGGVTSENAHPHTDCTLQLAVVHNGIVENFAELKKELVSKNHTFISETDTEVISHMVEELLKTNGFATSVRKAFLSLQGLNALVIVNAKSKEIIAAKNGSPLVVGKGKDGYYIASDVSGIIEHTREVLFLKDNQMVILGTQVQLLSLPEGKKLPIIFEKIDWAIEKADKGRFPHFMIKEIFEQPKVIRNIAQNYEDQLIKISHLIEKANGTFFIGAGTAFHACLVGMYLFSHLAKKHVNTAVASEFNYLEDFLTKKSLIIALSQSGETIDVIEPLNRAKEKGSKIIAFTNVLGSTIYRMADHKILLGAGPEKAVASTKAYIAKLSALLLLTFVMNKNMVKGRSLLLKVADEIDRLLKKSEVDLIKSIAQRLKNVQHLYVIGRGLSYPSALEGALKIKEVSYIHTEGLAGGELKHGTIALISPGTPCIVFAPHDETYFAMISNATEIKSRGGIIIGISHENSPVFDFYIEVKDIEEATVIAQNIPLQLLGYFLAVEKKLDPDKPRNLAKSVTVK